MGNFKNKDNNQFTLFQLCENQSNLLKWSSICETPAASDPASVFNHCCCSCENLIIQIKQEICANLLILACHNFIELDTHKAASDIITRLDINFGLHRTTNTLIIPSPSYPQDLSHQNYSFAVVNNNETTKIYSIQELLSCSNIKVIVLMAEWLQDIINLLIRDNDAATKPTEDYHLENWQYDSNNYCFNNRRVSLPSAIALGHPINSNSECDENISDIKQNPINNDCFSKCSLIFDNTYRAGLPRAYELKHAISQHIHRYIFVLIFATINDNNNKIRNNNE